MKELDLVKGSLPPPPPRKPSTVLLPDELGIVSKSPFDPSSDEDSYEEGEEEEHVEEEHVDNETEDTEGTEIETEEEEVSSSSSPALSKAPPPPPPASAKPRASMIEKTESEDETDLGRVTESRPAPPPPVRGNPPAGAGKVRVRVRIRGERPKTDTAATPAEEPPLRGQPTTRKVRVRVRVRGTGRPAPQVTRGQKNSDSEEEVVKKMESLESPSTAPPAKEISAAEKQVTSEGESVLYCGVCTKRGHVRHNWQDRFFVLTDKSVHYFESADKPKSKGCIPLKDATLIEEKQKTKKLVFSLTSKGKKTFIQALDADQYKEWVYRISGAITRA